MRLARGARRWLVPRIVSLGLSRQPRPGNCQPRRALAKLGIGHRRPSSHSLSRITGSRRSGKRANATIVATKKNRGASWPAGLWRPRHVALESRVGGSPFRLKPYARPSPCAPGESDAGGAVNKRNGCAHSGCATNPTAMTSAQAARESPATLSDRRLI
jgi:hypothetical protein